MSPRLIVAFTVALLVFVILPSGSKLNPATAEEILEKAHELREIAKVVLAGLVLLWVFNEALEHAFGPIIEKGLGKFDATLKRGFDRLTAALASEVRKSSERLASQSLPAVLESASHRPPQDPRREIAALLETTDESAWSKAHQLLSQHKIKDPALFLPLALRYWSIGNFADAISVAEEGLKLAENEEDKSRYKNTLAYYYAESENQVYEQLARQYATEARTARPDDPATLDTDGYVRISFATTFDEVKEGLGLCVQAMNMGYSPELYFRASERAKKKFATLQT